MKVQNHIYVSPLLFHSIPVTITITMPPIEKKQSVTIMNIPVTFGLSLQSSDWDINILISMRSWKHFFLIFLSKCWVLKYTRNFCDRIKQHQGKPSSPNVIIQYCIINFCDRIRLINSSSPLSSTTNCVEIVS